MDDGRSTHQLKSIICLSNTSFATTNGLADLVCHTDTERSSAPKATTEQMLEAMTGWEGSRRKMWGLYACGEGVSEYTRGGKTREEGVG